LATAASFSKIPNPAGEAVLLAGSAVASSPAAAEAKHFPPQIARTEIRTRAAVVVKTLDKREALSRRELEALSLALLHAVHQPASYLGWTMVVLWSEFWREQISAVPIARRLLLLPDPQSLAQQLDPKTTSSKPAANLLDPVVRLGQAAHAAGYQVHLARDSSSAMNAIVRGEADAILGAAPLDMLELAIEPLLATGIPCMAVPLPAELTNASDLEEAALRDLIQIPALAPDSSTCATAGKTRSYVALLREARRMFTPEVLPELLPGPRPNAKAAANPKRLDPLAGTGIIAEQFLAQGGKHSRPFIVMAVYDALTGGAATEGDGAQWVANLAPPSSVSPCRSRPFTKPRSSMTTSKTTTNFATVSRRCIVSTARRPRSMSAIT
jgi:geranylgeranyl diphosphate synthase type II